MHAGYFHGLTPPGFDYYAGNYRGSDFPCLRDSVVGIASDRRVGHAPGIVDRSMYEFASEVQDTVNEIDFLYRVSQDTMSEAESLCGAHNC